MSVEGDPPVGSIGEEAAKLLEALQEWARESGHEYAGAAAGAAEGAASTFQQVNEHLATGGADCRYCPLCQVIALVRSTSPEVRHHLGAAASSLLQAASGVLATSVPDRPSRPQGGFEHIDLSDEPDSDLADPEHDAADAGEVD